MPEATNSDLLFDEYRGGCSVGWLVHKFQLAEPVVRAIIESRLREQLELELLKARTGPLRVHISSVTAPLSWGDR